MPDRMPPVWQASQWLTTFPLRRLWQDIHRRARKAVGRHDGAHGQGSARPKPPDRRQLHSQHGAYHWPDRNTIMKLLVLLARSARSFMGRPIVNVPVKDVECDEIWGFVAKKEKTVQPDDDLNFGDAYCFVAIERNTKLVLNFALGNRDQATTDIFIEGLRHATAPSHFQITTDGFTPYVTAITRHAGDRVKFARLIKVYGPLPKGKRRYSAPPKWSIRRWSQLSEIPIPNASVLRLWSARTSPCGCRFAGSRA